MSDGPKAVLTCADCVHDTTACCILTGHNNEDGTPDSCPRMELGETLVLDGSLIANTRWPDKWLTPDEAEALATALLVAAQKARQA